MKCLELFCGSKSFGKCCIDLGYDVISLDIEEQFKPTHLCNILSFDYKQYDTDYFDIIWASPPCTEYSKAKTRGVRDIEGANEIVLKTIEIINYFKCKEWFIENPQTSLLKKQPFMNKFKFVDGDYCMYGLPYRKRTRIWTNKEYAEEPLKLCDKKCGSFINNKHLGSCGNGLLKYTNKSYSKLDKYKIPSEFIFSLLK